MFKNKVTKSEKRFFIYLLTGLLIWFLIIAPAVMPTMLSNMMIYYTIFIIAYSYIIFRYILRLGDPLKGNGLFLSYLMSVIAGDLIMLPYFITPSGVASNISEVSFITDLWVYELLPMLEPMVRYLAVYVFVPAGILFLARILAGKRKFYKGLKAGL